MRVGRLRGGRWLVPLLALVLFAVAGVVVAMRRDQAEAACGAGDRVVSGARARSPFLDAAGQREQPDARRQRLAAAVDAMGAPFGPVVGAVGYDYDQYVQVAAFDGGLGSWTRGNALFSFLDDATLRPRWGIENSKDPHAYDAGDGRYVGISLVKGESPEISSYDLRDGHRVWCRRGGPSMTADDPLATSVLPSSGDLVVLTHPRDGATQLVRLARADGATTWRVGTGDTDRGDFLGVLPAGPVDGSDGSQDSGSPESEPALVVAGGSEEFRLAGQGAPVVATTSSRISGFEEDDGSRRWTWASPDGSVAHVVGLDAGSGRVLVLTRALAGPDAGTSRLVALGRDGEQQWTRTVAGTAYQSTLRGVDGAGVVILREAGALAAYDAGSGRPLWRRKVPTDRTFFPYGFVLGSAPSLDATHVLLPTTTDLRILDVDTGGVKRYPLPTDGISTTFWPYQLAVTSGLVAVVTNTGAVVARNETGQKRS